MLQVTVQSLMCPDFIDNTASSVELDVNGSFRVEDFANRATNNSGVGSFVFGTGTVAGDFTDVSTGTCTEPNF